MRNFVPISQMTTTAVFLIGGVCVGVPALLYSAWVAHVSRKNGGRLSVFVVFLLLTDFLQSVFSVPVIAITVGTPWTFSMYSNLILYIIFQGLHYCGLYFHQLAALESVLFLKYPLYTSHLFSPPCSVSLSVFILVLVAMNVSVVWPIPSFQLALPPVAVLIITLALCARADPSSQLDTDAHKKARRRACIVAAVTMIAYLPFTLTSYGMLVKARTMSHPDELLNFSNALLVTWAITYLRLILDAVLCVFVCRSYRSVPTPRPHTELSANPGAAITNSS